MTLLTSLALTYTSSASRVPPVQQQQQQQESKSLARQILFLLGAIIRCNQAWVAELRYIPSPASVSSAKTAVPALELGEVLLALVSVEVLVASPLASEGFPYWSG